MKLGLALIVALQGLLLGFRIFFVDPAAEALRRQTPTRDSLRSPGRDMLLIASLEHSLAWADVMWLAIVQELGLPPAQEVYDRLERWAEIASDLDPLYYQVYHASAVHLTVYAHRVDRSDYFLMKGRRALPERWELDFQLGYNAYFVRGDARAGSEWMASAARKPKAPRYVGALAGRMRLHAGDRAGAIQLLETMVDVLEGPAKDDAEWRLKALRSADRLAKYDRACERFVEETGKHPIKGAELFARGLVDEPPVDLLGADIEFWSDDCIARTYQIRVREEEAEKRVGQFSLQRLRERRAVRKIYFDLDDPELERRESGLRWKTLVEAKGESAKAGQIAVVHYVGALADGTIFEDTRGAEPPAPGRFVVGAPGLISGFAEALTLLRAGGRARFVIPPELGYGARPPKDSEIPANSTLVFEMELLRIEEGEQGQSNGTGR